MPRSSPLALAGLVAVAGCGGREPRAATPPWAPPADRWATVVVDGEANSFAVDACERDGPTVHLTGRGETVETLDVVAEVGGDGETVAPAKASSITLLGVEQGDLAAVGPEAWAERGMTGEAPGAITASRLTDDLLQMVGPRMAVLDEDGRPTGDELKTFSLDALCAGDG